MTPLISMYEAWHLLHNDYPRLFEAATLDYQGKLKPGQTIKAEVTKRFVGIAVQFEVYHNGLMKFIHEQIPNMAEWEPIHRSFSEENERIPPLSCHVNEECRPYHDSTLLEFRLADLLQL
jgi:hypothetical protein